MTPQEQDLQFVRDRIAYLESYMAGFHRSLKNPGEQAYCQARSQQKARGLARPQGMSFTYGIDKDRVPTLEIVLNRVFKTALTRIGG